jgi:ABC-2 type transport system permease protein
MSVNLSNNKVQSDSKRKTTLMYFAFGLIVLFLINIIGNYLFFQLDLTGDKRYTLLPASKNMIKKVDRQVYIQVMLEGKFPAGFKRLQEATREILKDFNGINNNIQYNFQDPNQGSVEEVNDRKSDLGKIGIRPVNLRLVDNNESKEQLIYPYALIVQGENKVVVNLLENNIPGQNQEQSINNSIALLEYKLANGIQTLRRTKRPLIYFLTGHGELSAFQTADLRTSMSAFYDYDDLSLDTVTMIPTNTAALIVANPRVEFPRKDQFIIDQYIMGGGKVLYFLDKIAADLDSMGGKTEMIPRDINLGLDEQLFKYGVRIQSNLVLDLECSRIPLQIGEQGGEPQLQMFNWYYHPLATPTSFSPIVKNLDRVFMNFPSAIDTIATSTNVKKTILLTSSQFSRTQVAPMRVNFEMLRVPPQKEKFNTKNIPMAVMLEGVFPSEFKNRITNEFLNIMSSKGRKFLSESVPTKVLVVSDGNLIQNQTNEETKKFKPLGLTKYEKYVFANKAFAMNALEYMIDESGLFSARSKEVKLRLLNNVKANDNKFLIQATNIVGPVILLSLFGLFYSRWRKNKFGKKIN